MQQAVTVIKVYGGSEKLISLEKAGEFDPGIYSDRPINVRVRFTDKIIRNVKLRLSSYHQEGKSAIIECDRIQISDLLDVLGIENFNALITELKAYGWRVHQYTDQIQDYFLVDQNESPISLGKLVYKRVCMLIATFLCITMPAIILWLIKDQPHSTNLIDPVNVKLLALIFIFILSISWLFNSAALTKKGVR